MQVHSDRQRESMPCSFYLSTKHTFGLVAVACGFLASDCVCMRKEYRFTCTHRVHGILYLPSSFIQRPILTDSLLSVIWWWALFCLTSCRVALLCTQTVRIILWVVYLQPTLKSYSHRALSAVRSAWVGKGPERNTLRSELRVSSIHWENNSNSLDLLWTSGYEL